MQFSVLVHSPLWIIWVRAVGSGKLGTDLHNTAAVLAGSAVLQARTCFAACKPSFIFVFRDDFYIFNPHRLSKKLLYFLRTESY